jgi:hypothetical protein
MNREDFTSADDQGKRLKCRMANAECRMTVAGLQGNAKVMEGAENAETKKNGFNFFLRVLRVLSSSALPLEPKQKSERRIRHSLIRH